MKTVLLTSFLLLLAPGLAQAGSAPTPAEVQKVLDFYYGAAKASPILVETRVCRDVAKEGEHKNECLEKLGSGGIPVGESSYLWLNFMVPRDAGSQKILVQFEHDGVTRMTRQLDISAAIRFRTWKKFALDRPGQWSVKILHDKLDGTTPLHTVSLDARPQMVTSAAD